jgi:hypothetical protein
VLTGFAQLEPEMVQAHFETTKAQLGTKLDALLTRFAAIEGDAAGIVAAVRKEMALNADFAASAKFVLVLWYTGGVAIGKNWDFSGSASAYYRGLVWRVIGAHPPGLSNAYYGHWKYPPEI